MPEKEGLVGLGAAIEEVPRLGRDFIVERFHAFDGKRTFVHGLAVRRSRNNAARVELLAELGIGRPIRVLEFLVGVQVI